MAGCVAGSNATPQQRLEDVLARKATLLQSITVSPIPRQSFAVVSGVRGLTWVERGRRRWSRR